MKTAWDQNLLRILETETNVFSITPERILFCYSDHPYATEYIVHTNDELFKIVREIIIDLKAMYDEMECPELLPAEYLPFVS